MVGPWDTRQRVWRGLGFCLLSWPPPPRVLLGWYTLPEFRAHVPFSGAPSGRATLVTFATPEPLGNCPGKHRSARTPPATQSAPRETSAPPGTDTRCGLGSGLSAVFGGRPAGPASGSSAPLQPVPGPPSLPPGPRWLFYCEADQSLPNGGSAGSPCPSESLLKARTKCLGLLSHLPVLFVSAPRQPAELTTGGEKPLAAFCLPLPPGHTRGCPWPRDLPCLPLCFPLSGSWS